MGLVNNIFNSKVSPITDDKLVTIIIDSFSEISKHLFIIFARMNLILPKSVKNIKAN